MRTCTTGECTRKHFAMNKCRRHYYRKNEADPVRHGMGGTPTYQSWVSIRSRCNNRNHQNYEMYGGRGIRVCSRWDSFILFYEDMGDRPEGLTLDRKDTSQDYCKDNCEWVKQVTRRRNRSGNCRNRTGATGVYYVAKRKKYYATIGVDGKNKHVGSYDDIPTAVAARKEAEDFYWGAR